MPTYVYKFIDSGETLEVQQAFAEDALTEAVHPATGETRPVKKVFLPVGVTFRGGGFYKTDSRNGTPASTNGSSAATDSSSKEGGSVDSASKDSGSKDGGSKDSSSKDGGSKDGPSKGGSSTSNGSGSNNASGSTAAPAKAAPSPKSNAGSAATT